MDTLLTTPAPYTAGQIADWFIGYASIKELPLRATVLQKLLYYAQAHYLEEHEEVLFGDAITAWEHGPVVSNVWAEHVGDRQTATRGEYSVQLHEDVDYNDFSDDLNLFLTKVWNTYGSKTAAYLTNKTHKELPWKLCWNEDAHSGEVISPELILGYYKTRDEL